MKRQEILDLGVSNGYNLETLKKWFSVTDEINGCSFIGIRGFSNNKSENKEVANYVVNVGAAYSTQVNNALHNLGKLDKSELILTIITSELNGIDLAGLNTTKDQYKRDAIAAIPDAIWEKSAALLVPSERTNNYIAVNKVFSFNTKTGLFYIQGNKHTKKILVDALYKSTKKGAKTFTKELIEREIRPNHFSTFTVDNGCELVFRGEAFEL